MNSKDGYFLRESGPPGKAEVEEAFSTSPDTPERPLCGSNTAQCRFVPSVHAYGKTPHSSDILGRREGFRTGVNFLVIKCLHVSSFILERPT